MRRLAISAWVVILCKVLLAQGAAGTLTGMVTGPTGAPVPDAPIQAKNRQSGAVVRAVTAVDGRYRLAPLPSGSYDISISMPCCAFEPFAQTDVAIQAGQTRQLDVHLAEGASLNTAGDDPGTLAAIVRNRAKVPSRPVPRLAGKPDFSGVWLANEDRYPEQPALMPWAVAELQRRIGNGLKDAPHTRCLPQGIPTPASIGPFMAKTVQTPSLLVVLFEDTGGFRQIFLDGRPHPTDPDPSWVGHSIGKWDGDTLVVDTIGYTDQSWIGIVPHTEMLHVTERIRRPDFGHLEIHVTFEDPGTFSTPWHQNLNWELTPAEEVVAYVCENNKAERLVGK
jgi:Carboxypeptidase regulatory-like domain